MKKYFNPQIYNEDKLQRLVFWFFGSSFSLSQYKLYALSPTLEHQYFIFTCFYSAQFLPLAARTFFVPHELNLDIISLRNNRDRITE